MRRILHDALTAAGARVVRAHDVAEASVIARERISDVVIDLLLPGKGRGLGLIALTADRPPRHRSPVMVLIGKEVSPEEMAQLGDALQAAALST